MDLATHQRKLLGLIRSTYHVSSDDDAYFHEVSESRDLQEARRNIYLWRIYVLERTCALTVRLLRERNLLEDAVSTLIARHNISPFRETQGPAFLELLSGHDDELIASVAQFELALSKVRQGDPGSYEVRWTFAPIAILNNLAKDIPIDPHAARGAFRVLISRDLPFLFQIVCADSDEAAPDLGPEPCPKTTSSDQRGPVLLPAS
jgi:hypothetical protein